MSVMLIAVAFVSVVADDNRECPWDPAGTDSDGAGAMVPTGFNGFLALTGIPFDQLLTVNICERVTGLYDLDGALDLLFAACG